MKRVYIEPVWTLHPIDLKNIIPYPPEGYQFLTIQGLRESMFKLSRRVPFSFLLLHYLDRIAPLNLIKSFIDSFTKKPPKDSDLTFSIGHLILRKEPWVAYFGTPVDVLGIYAKHFKRYKGLIEKIFSSKYCRKILTTSEYGRRKILSSLDCTHFKHKIELLPCAVAPKKDFVKRFNDDKVKLLFMGSAALLGGFELRGGKEVLEAFSILIRKYSNLELVIRSEIPRHVRRKYHNLLKLPNIKLIERILPEEELRVLYGSCDIFVFPTHGAQEIILEAMSYQLPVIVADSASCREYVEDGKTGFVIRGYKNSIHADVGGLRPEALRIIRETDHAVVEELVKKTSILIEDKELRRRMGEAAREEVEHGKHSIERRREKLKKIFDEATT